MAKPPLHRPRWWQAAAGEPPKASHAQGGPRRHIWRATAVLLWALQGILAPWNVSPAQAANPDSLAIRVRAVFPVASDPVADLLASPNPAVAGQISLTWSAPEGYAGGTPFAGETVSRYSVRYATFSVDSLLGDTTSWWNAAAATQTTLQPPGHVPQAPGNLEAHTYTGLTPGGTYYFAVKSVSPGGVESPIDALADTPGQQATAVAAQNTAPTGEAPQMPNGVLTTSLANGLQVRLQWTPVTRDVSGNPIALDRYVIYRYTAIGSTPTLVNVASTASSYTENTGGVTLFYRVQAISTGNMPSALSDYLDSSFEANRYALASDDPATRVIMPRSAAEYLLAANNSYGEDLQVVLTRQPQDETNVTLRSYRATATIARTGESLTQFSFPQNNISVQLGYGAALGAPGGPVSVTGAPLDAAALASIISVYWYNGANYIRVGSPLLVAGNAVSVNVRNLGIYQIRVVTLGTAFRLTQGSPYPRVITPNGSENRRVFWFFDNPSGETVNGTIYDIRGAHVRNLSVNGMSPTANSLVWDGRDDRGAVVPSGVYLYKISTSEETVTGTVVVAR